MSHAISRWFAAIRRRHLKLSATSRTRAIRPRLEPLEDRFAPAVISVDGTADPDTFLVQLNGDNLEVVLNGKVVQSAPLADVDRVDLDALDGNDTITINSDVTVGTVILAGPGNDSVVGGRGPDLVIGADGNDSIKGARSRDTLDGGAGNDTLSGGRGPDSLFGGVGFDLLRGGLNPDNFGPRDALDTKADFTPGFDFRARDHTASHLLGTRTDLLPGAPDINNRPHTTEPIDYAALGFTNPPTYGPHHPSPVQPTGIYSTVLEDENLVHNLEHGHVWISYDPALISAADLAELEDVVEYIGSFSGVILAPRPANDTMIALVSWGRLQTLTSFSADAVRNFIVTNRGYAPEGFITA